MELAVASSWWAGDLLEHELRDVEVGMEDDVLFPEVHDLEGDGAFEPRMNGWGCEMNQQSASSK